MVWNSRCENGEALVKEHTDIATEMIDLSFKFMESNGVSKSLRKTYFALADDPEWYLVGKVIRKTDWLVSVQDALRFKLVTRILN